jgi:hypothetical protein
MDHMTQKQKDDFLVSEFQQMANEQGKTNQNQASAYRTSSDLNNLRILGFFSVSLLRKIGSFTSYGEVEALLYDADPRSILPGRIPSDSNNPGRIRIGSCRNPTERIA